MDALLARFAGGAEGEHAGFHRRAGVEPVGAAHFEQTNVALPVVEVPFERRGHGNGTSGAQHGSIFGERIGEANRRGALGAKHIVPRGGSARSGAKPSAAKIASISLSGTSAPITRKNSARVMVSFRGLGLRG